MTADLKELCPDECGVRAARLDLGPGFRRGADIIRKLGRRSVFGMTSNDERIYVYEFTANAYVGAGEIVDLGCWLGSSTISLAQGLRDNQHIADRDGRIHAMDMFVWQSWMNRLQIVNRMGLSGKYAEGESFLPEYENQIAPWADLVTTYQCDLEVFQWDGGPIEYLFVDAMKNWTLTDAIVRNFFGSLIPGRSHVHHNDWSGCGNIQVHLLMHRLRDYFVPVACADTATIFKCVREIPAELLMREWCIDDFEPPEIYDAFAYSLSFSERRMLPSISRNRVKCLEKKREAVESKKLLNRAWRIFRRTPGLMLKPIQMILVPRKQSEQLEWPRDLSRAASALFGIQSVVLNQTVNRVGRKFLAAFEKCQLDQKSAFDDIGVAVFHNFATRFDCATCGQQVVHHENVFSLVNRINVHFQRIGTVFELVTVRVAFEGKFPRLPNRHKSNTQFERQRRGENEPARLGGDHRINLSTLIVIGKLVDGLPKSGRIIQQRGNVFEVDSRLGKIGNVPNKLSQVDRCSVRHNESRHS